MQTEQEFLKKLSEKLKMLSIEDRNDIIDSYRQQFSEKRAEGMDDRTIISELEPIDEIVKNIKKEFNISRRREYQAKVKEQYNSAKSSSINVGNNRSSLLKWWKLMCHIAMIIIIIAFAVSFIATLFTMPLVIYIWGVTMHAIGFYLSLLCLELITLLISMRIISKIENMFSGGTNA